MTTHLPHVHLKAKDRRALDRQRSQRPGSTIDHEEWREFAKPLSADWSAHLRRPVTESRE